MYQLDRRSRAAAHSAANRPDLRREQLQALLPMRISTAARLLGVAEPTARLWTEREIVGRPFPRTEKLRDESRRPARSSTGGRLLAPSRRCHCQRRRYLLRSGMQADATVSIGGRGMRRFLAVALVLTAGLALAGPASAIHYVGAHWAYYSGQIQPAVVDRTFGG